MFTYLLLSCNEESFCKKHELEINNKIQVLVDSCLPSKYDEYKYIVELAVINKSSDTVFIRKSRRPMRLTVSNSIDTLNDAFLLFGNDNINKVKEEWEGGAIDYFPELLFSDSSYLYNKYFDAFFTGANYYTIVPNGIQKLRCVIAIMPYDRPKILQSQLKNTKDKPEFVLKLSSSDGRENHCWRYLCASNGEKIFNTIFLKP